MQKKHPIAIFLVIIGILAMTGSGFAQGIKERMKTRLPLIVDLKDRGIVGENNKGFLQFLSQSKEKTDVVEAENNDRSLVYNAIAKQQKTTPELVGRRRAVQIADKAKPGEWLQDEKGNWYQKK